MFIRQKTNKSGTVSIQIIDKSRSRYRVVRTIGTSMDPLELDRLNLLAKAELNRLSQPFDLNFDNDKEKELVELFFKGIEKISLVGPELIIGKLFDEIGFNSIKDELFRHLVITRLCNPVSKLKTTDYLFKHQGISIEVDRIYRYLDKLHSKQKDRIQEISETTVSNITEGIMASAKEWQQRTLEPVYFAVWMDGIVLKVRTDNKVINKCVYIVIGLKPDGMKEVLGFWIEKTESAAFWMSVLTDLKARGVEDILIACTDNLKGFTQAIKAVFSLTVTQICIVHQIRNSCKFVVWKDRQAFCQDLKKVYTAINNQAALDEFETFKQKWQGKYKYAITSWEENWDNLSNYFEYPLELRKIIYTTNTIENLNRGIRKYTKTKTQFPNENAASKSIYLAIKNIENAWSVPIKHWGLILNQYLIIFEGRCRI